MKFFWLVLLFLSQQYIAQTGFAVKNDIRKVTIPFQLINNLIFIPVEVNGVPLTFLLDTGVSQTLLFSLGDKEVNFKNVEQIKFSGLGGSAETSGLKSKSNMVKVTDDYVDYNHFIYIILNEDFNFSSYIGIPVHGILGYDFFKNNPIEVDYTFKKITIYNNDRIYKKRSKKFTEIPISIEKDKPYMMVDVRLSEILLPTKLLIDLGNSDAFWVFPGLAKDFIEKQPHIEDFLGRGFNGDVHGLRSRINEASIAEFTFNTPIAAMPDAKSIEHVQFVKDRKGSVGSEILRRFTVIFDYKNKKLLLRKNKNFEDSFRLNMSGLEFKHIGMKWERETVQVSQLEFNKTKSAASSEEFASFLYKLVLKPVYAIASVRVDSPAYNAGFKKDDVLESVNGKLTSGISLSELNEMMRHEEGKNFKFEILRNDVPLKFSFSLVDPIPYK